MSASYYSAVEIFSHNSNAYKQAASATCPENTYMQLSKEYDFVTGGLHNCLRYPLSYVFSSLRSSSQQCETQNFDPIKKGHAEIWE